MFVSGIKVEESFFNKNKNKNDINYKDEKKKKENLNLIKKTIHQ